MWNNSTSRRQAGHELLRGCQPFLQVDEPQTSEQEEDVLKFPYQEAVWALMWTATMTCLGIDQVLEPWIGALLKVCDVGHILPASHERVENHVL